MGRGEDVGLFPDGSGHFYCVCLWLHIHVEARGQHGCPQSFPTSFFEIGSLTESSIHQMARLTGRSSRNARMSCHSPTCAPSLRIQPCRCWVFKLRSPCLSSRYCANWTFSSLLLIHLNSRLKFLSCAWQTVVLNYGRGGKQRQECRARVGWGHREGGDPTTLSPQTAVYRILQQKPLEMQTDSSQGSSWGCDL